MHYLSLSLSLSRSHTNSLTHTRTRTHIHNTRTLAHIDTHLSLFHPPRSPSISLYSNSPPPPSVCVCPLGYFHGNLARLVFGPGFDPITQLNLFSPSPLHVLPHKTTFPNVVHIPSLVTCRSKSKLTHLTSPLTRYPRHNYPTNDQSRDAAKMLLGQQSSDFDTSTNTNSRLGIRKCSACINFSHALTGQCLFCQIS